MFFELHPDSWVDLLAPQVAQTLWKLKQQQENFMPWEQGRNFIIMGLKDVIDFYFKPKFMWLYRWKKKIKGHMLLIMLLFDPPF